VKDGSVGGVKGEEFSRGGVSGQESLEEGSVEDRSVGGVRGEEISGGGVNGGVTGGGVSRRRGQWRTGGVKEDRSMEEESMEESVNGNQHMMFNPKLICAIFSF